MFNLYRKYSRSSNSLNYVNFTITLSVTFCIIQGDPHRRTQMDPTRPNPLSKEKIWTRPNPWMDPTYIQLWLTRDNHIVRSIRGLGWVHICMRTLVTIFCTTIWLRSQSFRKTSRTVKDEILCQTAWGPNGPEAEKCESPLVSAWSRGRRRHVTDLAMTPSDYTQFVANRGCGMTYQLTVLTFPVLTVLNVVSLFLARYFKVYFSRYF